MTGDPEAGAATGPAWPDDSQRPLTQKGISRFRDIAARLAARGIRVGAVFSSPYVRARQTAELLVPGWAEVPIQSVEELSPGYTPASLAKVLLDQSKLGETPGRCQVGFFNGARIIRNKRINSHHFMTQLQ